MPSTIPAVLLDIGRNVEKGWSVDSITLTYCSSSVRPDVSASYLPTIGDVYNPSGICLSTQTLIPSTNQYLICKKITETYFADDHTVGSLYSVYYDTVDETVYYEPTQDPDAVIMSIQSGASVDAYTYDPREVNQTKIYVYENGTWKEIESVQSIPKTTSLINVQTTTRYREPAIDIIALGNLAGYTNDSTMWGQGAGCILYNGINAQPLQEIYNDTKTISWNVTNSYTIRYIPGITTNTWDYIFYKGNYTRIATDAAGTNLISLYQKTAIPNDLV